MADIQHKNIIDPNIHEPKGVQFAAENTAYIADGAGSGSWQPVVLPGAENAFPSKAFTVVWDIGTTNLSSNILLPVAFTGPLSDWGDLGVTVSEGFLSIDQPGVYAVNIEYDISVSKDSPTPEVVNIFSVRPTRTKLSLTALDGLFLPELIAETTTTPATQQQLLSAVLVSFGSGEGIGFWATGSEGGVPRITNATLNATLRITRISNA